MELFSRIKYLNTLADFCAPRDLAELSKIALKEKYGIDRVSVCVLFGATVLAGADLLAQAVKEDLAEHYMIVGGEGHTTPTLRGLIHDEIGIPTDSKPEAEILRAYLLKQFGVEIPLIETKSTNCGNNVTNCLALLRENGVSPNSILIMQDATMQGRMDAVFRKHFTGTIINYPTYEVRVIEKNSALAFDREIHGMWTMDHYIDLLMGEIPRMTDDENGYGPNGKNYQAHTDVPAEVTDAYRELSAEYHTREANSAYATN